jgi:hypothetical protein
MIIQHRVNTIRNLGATPKNFGVEIDLRLFNGELILAHDPFTLGEKFDEWIESYDHKTLILNVKEDGLEDVILEKLKQHRVKDYFFLDQPFPTLRKTILKEIPTAFRLSEYENPVNDGLLKPSWIWLDSFSGDWTYLEKHAEWIQNGGYKTCLVSPELHGRDISEEPKSLIDLCETIGLSIDAVCTKHPMSWEVLSL